MYPASSYEKYLVLIIIQIKTIRMRENSVLLHSSFISRLKLKCLNFASDEH